MALEIKRIFHIADDANNLNPGQLGVMDTPDPDLGFRAWVGKDYANITTTWLAKDRPGRLTGLRLTDAEFTADIGFVRHSAVGQLQGGKITVAQLNDLLIDGPIGDTSISQAYTDLGSSGLLSGGGISDAGSQLFDVAAGEGLFRTTASHLGDLEKLTWAASTGNAIPDGAARWVFAAYSGGAVTVSVRTSYTGNGTTDVFLGVVTREGTVLHISNVPDLTSNPVSRLNERFRHSGIAWVEGMAISNTGTQNLYIEAGEAYFKLVEFPLPVFDSSATGTFDIYVGATKDSTAATQWPNGFYNNGDVKTALGTGHYSCLWFYRELDGNVVVMYGSSNTPDEAVAEAEQPPTTLPLRVQTHGFLLGRFIIKQGQATPVDVESARDGEFVGTPVGNHELLSSLLGGDASGHWHLSASEQTGLVGGGSAGALHRHDAQYVIGLAAGRVPFGTGAASGLSSDSAFFWDNTNKRLGLGTSAPAAHFHIDNPTAPPVARMSAWGADGAVGPFIQFLKGNSDTTGVYTAIGSGHSMGVFTWFGADGAGMQQGAQFRVKSASAFTGSVTHSAFIFETAPAGSNTLGQDLYISGGRVVMATTTVGVGTLYGLHMVNTTDSDRARISLDRYSASSSASLQFRRSHGAAIGNYTALESGDTIALMLFTGADGSAWGTGGYFEVRAGQAWTAGHKGTSYYIAGCLDDTVVNVPFLALKSFGQAWFWNSAIIGNSNTFSSSPAYSLMVGYANNVTIAHSRCFVLGNAVAHTTGSASDSILAGNAVAFHGIVSNSIIMGSSMDYAASMTVGGTIVVGSGTNADRSLLNSAIFGGSHAFNTGDFISSFLWGSTITSQGSTYAGAGGADHTISGSYNWTTGNGNTNLKDYAYVHGIDSKALWEDGNYITSFATDGATDGISQGFGGQTFGYRFSSPSVRGLGRTLATGRTFYLEHGAVYVIEVLLHASWVTGSYFSGVRSQRVTIQCGRGIDDSMWYQVDAGTLMDSGFTAPGSFSYGVSGSPYYSVNIHFTPHASCNATYKVDATAIVLGGFKIPGQNVD